MSNIESVEVSLNGEPISKDSKLHKIFEKNIIGETMEIDTKLKTKVENKYPVFVDEVQGLSIDQLEQRLINNTKYAEETERARNKDEALNKAKDQVKYLNEPYKDTLAAIKDKTKYILALIEEKGGQI